MIEIKSWVFFLEVKKKKMETLRGRGRDLFVVVVVSSSSSLGE